MFKRTLAMVLSTTLIVTGCASGGGPRVQAAPTLGPRDRAVLAEYAQKLPPGSRVRVERTTGSPIRGTLVKATADTVVVQRNTRLPEAPIDIPIDQITRLTLETGSGIGKTIGIAVAAGAAATFGILLLLAALLND